MKVILITMGILCSFFFSQKGSEGNASTLLKYHIGAKGDYVLFFNPTDSLFFLVQTTQKVVVPNECKFASYSKSELSIIDAVTQKATTYKVGGDIIGISKMGGPRYFQAFTTEAGGSIQIDANPDSDVWGLVCNCVSNSTTTSCQSGGLNSNGCEITDGGQVAGVAWTNHCQVSCNTGFYACCNE